MTDTPQDPREDPDAQEARPDDDTVGTDPDMRGSEDDPAEPDPEP
jgi:hypothetical protein